ncbi:hypothetical protein IV203_009574 [Nitzschia inconspicua]|uniref:Uncharacterized protein n=1 Tax=Nitzschia inconspicua TaxID=303405 RepID=A0A9K3KVL6_9STRA|nr:hypothetical protein IV203_009574 [Nitzschia inconspicua]
MENDSISDVGKKVPKSIQNFGSFGSVHPIQYISRLFVKVLVASASSGIASRFLFTPFDRDFFATVSHGIASWFNLSSRHGQLYSGLIQREISDTFIGVSATTRLLTESWTTLREYSRRGVVKNQLSASIDDSIEYRHEKVRKGAAVEYKLGYLLPPLAQEWLDSLSGASRASPYLFSMSASAKSS